MYDTALTRYAHVEPVNGSIKTSAEDFIVEEIANTGYVMEVGKQCSPEDLGLESKPGKFAVFVLQKKNWNTVQALKMIARKNNRGIKSVAFAGTKDRTSISTQLCSLFGADPNRILSLHIKDISINGAWQNDSAVKMGDLLGNRFTVNVKIGNDIGSALRSLDAISTELYGRFPNYFGSQRFGNRGNNVDIGVHMLKGEFEDAAMAFLADPENESMEEAVEARKRLAAERDFKAALSYFPAYLKYERLLLDYLARYPGNYANAMRRLPRQLFLMFVHSVESYIFNAELADRMAGGGIEPTAGDIICKSGKLGFPDMSSTVQYAGGEGITDGFVVGNIVGYETANLTDFEKELLERLGLKREDFMMKGIPELNSKGGQRVLFAPYSEFAYAGNGENSVSIRFA
ncbi:MAG: tRNA pseudouridine(13) synthase TruD, partial [Candidatus Micrarchaeaceae archaeon]